MERIDTDYKRRIWKIEAKLFHMRKPWRSSFKGATSRFAHLENLSLNFSSLSFVIRVNLLPSTTILVPLWIIISSLVFFCLSKPLFLGFLQFEGNFAHGQNTSKYRDWAPLKKTSSRFSLTAESSRITTKLNRSSLQCVQKTLLFLILTKIWHKQLYLINVLIIWW